jgi:hypothetical protein
MWIMQWMTFLDAEGRVMDPRALKKRIFHGGVEQKLRRVVLSFTMTCLGVFCLLAIYLD